MLRRRLFAALAALLLASVWIVALPSPATAAVPSGPRTLAACSAFVEAADVSQWQGSNIDWQAYATQRPAAFLKATEGVSFKDPTFDGNTFRSALAGVATGPYHFAQPSRGDAVREAKWFVSVAHADIGPGHLPPALDLEANPYGLSGPELDDWALTFLNQVRTDTGVAPIIYTGAYFAGVGGDARLSQFGLWIPAYNAGYQANPNPCTIGYPSVPNAWGNRGWDAWQFTSSNDTAGIAGHVDMSVIPPNVLAEWLGTGPVEPLPPTSTGDPQPADPGQIVWGIGSHGPRVAQIQSVTNAFGCGPAVVDGAYGPRTALAVACLQRKLGVPADGSYGPRTDQAVADFFTALAAVPSGRPRVGYGTTSQDVCDTQALLDDNGYDLTIDCQFGPATNHVLIDWQDKNGIPHGLPFSVLDGPTWESLGQTAA